MRQLPCPICRATVPPEATHCPHCGIRIAPLDRPRRAVPGSVDSRPPPAITIASRGAAWGLGLTVVCAVVAGAYALASGGFLRALGNASALAGGLTLSLSLLLGGVRAFRLADPDRLRRAPARRASTATRLSVAIAGIVPLALSIALAAAGR